MKIYSVDFEKVVKHYKNYVNKMLDLEQVKMKHQSEMEVFKIEMESIISSANSGLIIDENTQKIKMQRFKEIQAEASQKENIFRSNITQSQSKIMEDSFDSISSLINQYAKSAKIDMIVSKSQLIFVKDDFDITDIILDIMKEKDIFYENEKES
jgi:Skp family chaperone for outer membrane proteins